MPPGTPEGTPCLSCHFPSTRPAAARQAGDLQRCPALVQRSVVAIEVSFQGSLVVRLVVGARLVARASLLLHRERRERRPAGILQKGKISGCIR